MTLVGEARGVPFRAHLSQQVRRHGFRRRVATGLIDQNVELHAVIRIIVGKARFPITVSRRKA